MEQQSLAEHLARVGTRLRNELVHPPAVVAGDVDRSVRVHVQLVRARQAAFPRAGCLSVRAPVVLELAIRVVLEDPVEPRGDHPDPIILVDVDVDGVVDIGPLLDELAILGEDLDAIVRPVADVDAAVAVDGEAVEEIELARPVPEAAELADEFAVLGVLDDAGIPVTVREQEAAVGEEGEL